MKGNLFLLVILMVVFSSPLEAQDTTLTESMGLCNCPSQSEIGKGTLYLMWGYNRDWFSKSDIHFKNTSGDYNSVTKKYDSYNFTLEDVKAKDRAALNDIFRTALSIPQYSYRLGYFFNGKHDLGIEISFDHAKYVIVDNQNLHLKGTIHGQYYDQDTIVNSKDFLAFEHSDGANFLMLNFIKRQNMLVSKQKKHWLSGIIKVGAGAVIPRTDITLFGEKLNTKFHLAGYIFGIEGGVRYDAFKYVFMEYTVKGSWANYANVLSIGKGEINHSFYTFENILLLGLQFPL